MPVRKPDPRLEHIKAAQAIWQQGQPRRCETNQVGAAGECLACDAEQGVHCQKPDEQGWDSQHMEQLTPTPEA